MAKARKLPPYSADEIAADPDLAAALVRESEPLLHIERQMKALREQKADLFDDLRLSRYKPEFAKAWVAAQMPDEEKDALRAEKAMELARVVAAMDSAKAGQARARAGVRPREAKPAPRQEDFDEHTGEVLGDAPAPSGEIAEVGEDDSAHSVGGTVTEEAAAETNRITRSIAEQFGRGAETSTATSGPEVATTPYRIEPRAPAQGAPVEPQHELIASTEARMAKALELLGRAQEAAE